ncbi:ATP-dependent helicase [Corynebacterium poyangense]|uniref:ATP-dependent helicase n=1 Tax=Corynebacterium poyangense TaxID=2684405 RepID=A0A7H0SNA1_9CORY|nr:DEAD/DEAH box helicase [Corynebacterium poyangense]MBZ8177050.1 ATP-dependent helicase [Corynebacterium poyangense]QNQ90026.1 ATP-dependent helicase [Corynebacterium poyangense]
MADYLLHGLWIRGSGLHVWIEKKQGHKIVLPSAVPQRVFPPVVTGILEDRRFRHRLRATLKTPKGKNVELIIPTAAYGGPAAVELLSQLSFLDDASPAATLPQQESIAPDMRWLIRFYRGLEKFVRAGRVVFGLRYEDRQWWPQWQLSSGLDERGWIAAMTSCAPGILKANNSLLSDDLVSTLPHWIAADILDNVLNTPGVKADYKWHDFPRALVKSEPLRRGGAQVLNAINEWRTSITLVDLQLMVIVEEPETEGFSEEQSQPWVIRVKVRSGTDAPRAVNFEKLDRATKERLQSLHRTLVQVSPRLDPEHNGFYDPMNPEHGDWDVALSSEDLVHFILHDAEALQANGFQVLLPKSWSTAKAHATLRTKEPSGDFVKKNQGLGLKELVQYDWRISLGGTVLSDEEMKTLVDSKSGLINLRGKWVLADRNSLTKVSEYVQELDQAAKKRLVAEIEKLRMELQLVPDHNVDERERIASDIEVLQQQLEDGEADTVSVEELRKLALEASSSEPVEFTGSQWHSSLLGGTEQVAPERMELPVTIHAELREYQRRGVDWLYWMSRNQVGAILADDMGLGKTLQFLSLLAVEQKTEEKTGPSLVVAPTSVVGNWGREAARFVPSLQVYVHHGSNRLHDQELLAKIEQSDLVISSYGVVSRDFAPLSEITWDHVVLDEAQQVKNPRTLAAKAVRAIPARHRIALTGTPVENRLAEMRSILDFCNPGVLGSASFFHHYFAKPIERDNDPALTEKLRNLTAPFILRRLKTDPGIVDDLPDKQEQIVTVALSEEQASLYTALVDNVQKLLESTRAEDKMARRGIVLATITKIKQICNHPAHFLGDGSPVLYRGKHRSGKVEELIRLVDSSVAAGEKLLIFTQYRAFGDILQPYLSRHLGENIPFLHGGVSKAQRDAMVDNFQSRNGPSAMLLSLKAGGTGLNLTAASVVIHMDRWWNPAVENQATDRAYRIGQDKNVSVYKMLTAGTMEESIQRVLEGKLHLATAVVNEGEGWITELSPEDFAELMSYRDRDGGK